MTHLRLLLCWILLASALQGQTAKRELTYQGKSLPAWAESLRSEVPGERLGALRAFQQLAGDAESAVPTLIKLLRDPSLDVRVAAVLSLEFIGPEAKDALVPLLEASRLPDAPLFRIGLALARMGPEARKELLLTLAHRDATLRRGAAHALRHFRRSDQEVVAALGQGLRTDRDPLVRATCASSLGSLGEDSIETLPLLLAGLKDSDRIVREATSAALALVGATAVPRLGELLNDLSNPDRAWAALALARMGNSASRAIPNLTRALDDPSPEVRRSAAQALVGMWTSARDAVPQLSRLLKDPDVGIRLRAAIVLYRIENKLEGTGPTVREAVRKGDLETRRQAVTFLLTTHGRIPDAQAVLVEGLRDADGTVRRISAQALNMYRPPLDTAIKGLARALRDRESSVRIAAAGTLYHLRTQARIALPAIVEALPHVNEIIRGPLFTILQTHDTESVPLLVARLTDREADVRVAMIDALAALGDDAQAAMPALTKAIEDASPVVRLHAARATGQVGGAGKYRLDVFEQMLKHREVALRQRSAALLAAAIREPGTMPLLTACLRDNDPLVRLNAVNSAARPGSSVRAVLPLLVESLGDRDPRVRREASRALVGMAKHTESAVPAIIRGLIDHDQEVVNALTEVLRVATRDAIRTLLDHVTHTEPQVRAGAIAQLGRMAGQYAPQEAGEPRREAVLAALRKGIEDRVTVVRREAMTGLRRWVRYHSESTTDIERCIKDEDAAVREQAALALMECGRTTEACLPSLLTVIQRGPQSAPIPGFLLDEDVHHDFERASLTVQGYGPRAGDNLPALVAMLDDPRGVIRQASLSILGSMGGRAKEAVSAVAKRLEDRRPAVQGEAISALEQLGPEAASAVPSLNARLATAEPEFAERVLRALAAIGPPARQASPALIGLLRKGTPTVRLEAIRALGRIGEGAVSLAEVFRSEKREERQAAADSLSMMGPKAAPALDMLRKVLREDEDPEVRLRAALALLRADRRGAEDAWQELKRGLESENETIRLIAVRLIGVLGREAGRFARDLGRRLDEATPHQRQALLQTLGSLGPEAVPVLCRALESSRASVRRQAALALADLGQDAKDAVAALEKRMNQDGAEGVCRACAVALGRIGAPGKTALVRALQSEMPGVREMAARMLGDMGPLAKDSLDALKALAEMEGDEQVKQAAEEAVAAITTRRNPE